ncbi:hypothetical protein [Pseudomonas sp. O11]|uniref:hypothetical protein n=1 Tax=Pseudomonas sp. O11 TaxID=3159446 RepID=UPI00387B75AC
MSKDNSEPAFPSDSNEFGCVLGMSLRDYFAAKALQGMTTDGWQANDRTPMAIEAYRLADSMLAARSA